MTDAADGRPTSGWVDSHAHLTALSIDPEAAMVRARAAGVVGVVCVGTDLASSRAAARIAAGATDVTATAGLHPHDADRFDEEWDDLAALAAEPHVAAVGETGLDFHYDHSPRDRQVAAFRAQVRLAADLDRALVVHSRDAWDATFAVLEEEGPPPRTVLHCFTGGPDEARRAVELGLYLSFSGIVTFRNAAPVRAAAAATPLERLLVETDAPYLAPVPHRGTENEPARVPVVGAALAVATGHDPAVVAAATATAAAAVFGLPAAR